MFLIGQNHSNEKKKRCKRKTHSLILLIGKVERNHNFFLIAEIRHDKVTIT